MAVSAERFAQGLSYQQYRAQMTRNQDRFDANERHLTLAPEDLAAFQGLPHPVKILVLAEDWCGDVIDNLPILGRLAAESGMLDVRIFLRDQHLDLMDQYLKNGQFRSIPVFVSFDEEFRELGRFIERPESVTSRRAAFRAQIYAQHPEFGSPDAPVDQLPEEARARLMQELATYREQSKTQDELEVVQAIRALVART